MPGPQIADLDRCQHGRHVLDPCFGCAGGNSGNPHLDVLIGYQVRGEPFTVRDLLRSLDPDRALRLDSAVPPASQPQGDQVDPRVALHLVRAALLEGGQTAEIRARRALAALEGRPDVECTGLTARWCPLHGRCTCRDDDRVEWEIDSLDDPLCPLHSPDSLHAE